MGILFFVLGGFFNLYKFHSRFGSASIEEMPHLNQGYIIAFITGAVIYGGLMYLLYIIIS